MKFSSANLLLAGAGIVSALPHRDSPRERLMRGLDLGDRSPIVKKDANVTNPYTPQFRDPLDSAVDSVGEHLDPLPWRNGLGASVLGPWNPERARQNPDLVRPPSTDHGDLANMRWSFVDSHIRIEVRE
jgi:hypothetical protein